MKFVDFEPFLKKSSCFVSNWIVLLDFSSNEAVLDIWAQPEDPARALDFRGSQSRAPKIERCTVSIT